MSTSDSTDSGVARSVSGSPVGDTTSRPLTPRLPNSRSTSGSQTQMSPILETPRVAPDVTQHCERNTLSPLTSEAPVTSPVAEDEVFEKGSPGGGGGGGGGGGHLAAPKSQVGSH